MLPNGEIDYKSPEYLAAYDAETSRVSTEMMHVVYRLREEHEEAQAKALRLKRELEDTRNGLFKYLKEREDTRGRKPDHLFATVEAQQTLAGDSAGEVKRRTKGKAGPEANASGAAAVNGQTPAALPPGDKPVGGQWYPDDIWKQFPLERLTGYGLTQADLEKLREGVQRKDPEPFPMVTMGDVSKYTTPTASGYTRRLADIKGLGPAAVERLENAMTSFWHDWPGLADGFAVEKGHRRPDPLAPEPADPPTIAGAVDEVIANANRKEPQPGDAGGPGAAGGGDGAGPVAGVPGADHRHESAYAPDPAEQPPPGKKRKKK